MTAPSAADIGDLPLPDLLDLSLSLATELSTRLTAPDFPDALPRFPQGPERDRSHEWGLYAGLSEDTGTGALADGSTGSDPAAHPAASDHGGRPGAERTAEAPSDPPAGTLPEITTAVERLSRAIHSSQTALAGHVDRIFDRPDDRREVLGIPPGKCAFRHARDYLREHLHIHRREAARRMERAGHLLSTRTVDHAQVLPPPMPILAEALLGTEVDPDAADLIATTLGTARREAVWADAPVEVVDELLSTGERLLVANARDVDPETLRKICGHWRQRFDALVDPDGREPSAAEVDATQGLFYRGRRGRGTTGLHRWEVLATDGQHEVLQTVAAAASNPRAAGTDGSAAPAGTDIAGGPGAEDPSGAAGTVGEDDILDPRSRGQKQLDGLVSALTGALALTTSGPSELPASGGARPQVLVTIDYESLLHRVHGRESADTLLSEAAYTGPIAPEQVRQWACDAELIPVVLGGQGQVLDVGRAQRLFPRRLRQALVARDGGCAAPNCTIPAPWCEAHHVDHWEHGGPTSVDNGVLLCSHHHHAVHAGTWEISVREGMPWFIPAPYLDPSRRPRRTMNRIRFSSAGSLDPPAGDHPS